MSTQSRRNLRLSEIGEAIQVRHIETPLTRATTFDVNHPAAEAREELARLGFDSAPVQEDGKVVGIFDRQPAERSGVVKECMRSLWPGLLITANTPVPKVLDYLEAEPLLLILDHRGITGLITPSDLNSAAGKSYFYLLFAAAEIALVTYLGRLHDDQEVTLSALSQSRREAYGELKEKLVRTDSFLDTFSSLSIDDLVAIAGESNHFRKTVTDLYHGKSFKKHIKGKLSDHRNDIMHAARKLATVEDLVKARDRARVVTEAAEECLDKLQRPTN